MRKLVFKGAMINGRTQNRFLDDPWFRPTLEAAALDVPLYLHPTVPSKAVQDPYYAGLDPVVSTSVATAGWGWHMETGIHALLFTLFTMNQAVERTRKRRRSKRARPYICLFSSFRRVICPSTCP
jgi:predicted TIM-barrel fold metal-dependent hydrolase